MLASLLRCPLFLQNFAYPVAELQLAKGGIRLANVVNAIFASPSMAEYVVPREEFLLRQKKAELIAEY